MKTHSVNNADTRKVNKNLVFRYLLTHKDASRPNIASALSLSQPTVLSLITELMDAGLVTESGTLESTGGRKAKSVNAVLDHCYAIGIDITESFANFVLTDLSNQIVHHNRYDVIFEDTDSYYQRLAQLTNAFIAEANILSERILNVGISLPATIDVDSQLILHSEELKLENVPASKFGKYVPWDCVYLNDAFAAAYAEHLLNKDATPFYYCSLSNVSEGVYVNSTVETSLPTGDISTKSYVPYARQWRGGSISHVTLHPNGKPCSCGKQGCFEMYCSVLHLVNESHNHTLSGFMKMRESDKRIAHIWDAYLDNLAILLSNLHCVLGTPIVVGGRIGGYIDGSLDILCNKIAKLNHNIRKVDYVKVCRQRIKASALGAANVVMEAFINQV